MYSFSQVKCLLNTTLYHLDVVSNEKVVQGTGSQMLASFLHDDSLSRSNPTSSTPVSHLSAFPRTSLEVTEGSMRFRAIGILSTVRALLMA